MASLRFADNLRGKVIYVALGISGRRFSSLQLNELGQVQVFRGVCVVACWLALWLGGAQAQLAAARDRLPAPLRGHVKHCSQLQQAVYTTLKSIPCVGAALQLEARCFLLYFEATTFARI
jgi:hypothetical protein